MLIGPSCCLFLYIIYLFQVFCPAGAMDSTELSQGRYLRFLIPAQHLLKPFLWNEIPLFLDKVKEPPWHWLLYLASFEFMNVRFR